MVPEFLSVLLILFSHVITSAVFEHSCGNGYNCEEEDSLSYLVYEIYYPNEQDLDISSEKVKINISLDHNDYDLKTVGVFATYQDLGEPYIHSPQQNHGNPLYYTSQTSTFSDDIKLEVPGVYIPPRKNMRISVLIEVLEDSNSIFEDVSAIITLRTEMYVQGKPVLRTSDWKKIGEIDDNLIKMAQTDKNARTYTSTEAEHQRDNNDPKLLAIFVMTAVALCLSLVCSAIFYIYYKIPQGNYILMDETNSFI